MHVVIAGGGVGGLALALALGRHGHQVTVVERDPLPATADAEEAFLAERRGAPQAHQTHGFLARTFVELRRHFPDVLDDLMAVGGTTMPMTNDLGEPQPGDEDLRVLIVRRTTFEWVLRRAAVAQRGVRFVTGETVIGLVATPGRPGPGGHLPVVTGVALDNGATLAADVVVAATGRRGDVPAWLGAVGVDVPETVHESGLMYLSRWYRLPEALDLDLDPKLGGDLGFVKYLAVPGDGRTLSITLALRPEDTALRRTLSVDAAFEEACRILPGPSQFFAHGPLVPVGGVRPMGGLMNRLRRFVDPEGRPTALGFHAIGDAHTCTNPLYGRGCSLALAQALLLADAVADHPGVDAAAAEARAAAYEAGAHREVEPWFEASVQMDELGADPAGLAGARDSGPGKAMAAVFVAAATDPIIGRGLARLWNLLMTPAEMAADAVLTGRMAEVMANPDAYPTPAPEGPTREALLDHLAPFAAPFTGTAGPGTPGAAADPGTVTADIADPEEQSVA
ncbi:MAG TPA: FAD-dependent oxidoreductase [Acidimicrobiales bacterium]|nr:FAD-dependent oxidoreductase [Acidimicrobiales bacterium]